MNVHVNSTTAFTLSCFKNCSQLARAERRRRLRMKFPVLRQHTATKRPIVVQKRPSNVCAASVVWWLQYSSLGIRHTVVK